MDNITTDTLTLVDLSALLPSPTAVQAMRRKRYEKTTLAELANSIRQSGLLQPIIVRPANSNQYEIVAGREALAICQSRRPEEHSHSRSALSDAQVLSVQLVENLQRENLHPLEEEAEGYELILKQGATIEGLM